MPKPQWRKLRVVVEVPARGEVSEKDLAWAIKLALGDNALLVRRMNLRTGSSFGKLDVKEFGKVLTALRRKNQGPPVDRKRLLEAVEHLRAQIEADGARLDL